MSEILNFYTYETNRDDRIRIIDVDNFSLLQTICIYFKILIEKHENVQVYYYLFCLYVDVWIVHIIIHWLFIAPIKRS